MRADIRPTQQVDVVLATVKDPLVVHLIGRALREAGIPVIQAQTCEEALNRAAFSKGPAVVIVPSVTAELADAYTAAVRLNDHLRVLIAVTTHERSDLLELRLLGSDVGYRDVVKAVHLAVSSPIGLASKSTH